MWWILRKSMSLKIVLLIWILCMVEVSIQTNVINEEEWQNMVIESATSTVTNHGNKIKKRSAEKGQAGPNTQQDNSPGESPTGQEEQTASGAHSIPAEETTLGEKTTQWGQTTQGDQTSSRAEITAGGQTTQGMQTVSEQTTLRGDPGSAEKSVKPIISTEEESLLSCIHSQQFDQCDSCKYVRYNPDSKQCRVFAEAPENGKAWKLSTSRTRCLKKGFTVDTIGGVCYKITEEKMSWERADEACGYQGGTLLTVSTKKMKLFLTRISGMFSTTADNGDDYIWMHKMKINGVIMTWVKDGSSAYSPEWETGQPEYLMGVSEHCVAVSRSTHRWVTKPCSTEYSSLCVDTP